MLPTHPNAPDRRPAKVFDVAGQLLMLAVPVIMAVYHQRWGRIMMAYPAIGIWQFASLSAHAVWGTGTTYRQAHRRVAQWVIFLYCGLTAIATCYSWVALFVAIHLWFYIGPFFYLWYFWICLEEVQAMAKPSNPESKQ